MSASTAAATLAKITRKSMEDLKDRPDDIMRIRFLYENFIDEFDTVRETSDSLAFFIWWIYKNFAGDILQSYVEDDVLVADRLPERVAELGERLTASWNSALRIRSNGHADSSWAAWGKEVLGFTEAYQELLNLRRSRAHATVGGLKFLVPPPHGELLGLPAPRSDDGSQSDDPTLRMFPDLDATVTDPITNRRITRWYAHAIRQIQERAQARGEQVTTLCFIEKSFSVVGAVTLAAGLVAELGLPAVIYRRGYADGEFRVSGTPPRPGGSAILVYDVVGGGGIMRSGVDFLKKQYGVRTLAGVTSYDFNLGAGRRLSEVGVELVSFLERRNLDHGQVRQALNGKQVHSPDSSPAREREEGEEVNVVSPKEGETNHVARASTIFRKTMKSFEPIIQQAEHDLEREAPALARSRQSRRPVTDYPDVLIKDFEPIIQQAERELGQDNPPGSQRSTK